jgi:hypothetical protein
VLYELLYTERGDASEALDKEYRYLTTDLLIRPPRFAVVEEAIFALLLKASLRKFRCLLGHETACSAGARTLAIRSGLPVSSLWEW